MDFKGLGTVYFLTLLYFFSRGSLPIYDKYAFLGLKAICEGIEAGNQIKYKPLPDRHTEGFHTVMDKEMKDYRRMLKDAFGDEYNRSIDRSLWVYGHQFVKGSC